MTHPDATWGSYSYDPMGNRTELADQGGTTAYGYDISDRLFTASGQQNLTFSWDPRGNQTAKGSQTFGYNAANRLTSANTGGSSATYGYNGEGVRIGKTVNGTATSYLQDLVGGLPRVLIETTGGQETLYVYGLGLAFEVRPDGTRRYYHSDALGSTRVVTDDAGQPVSAYNYDAYGGVRAQAGEGRSFAYTGEQLDTETSFVFLRARYYDPAVGRFLSHDTIVADPTNSQDLNRYAYGRSNPMVFTDPSGHFVLFVGGMGTDNDVVRNIGSWRTIRDALQLRTDDHDGEGYGFFDWGSEPYASSWSVSLREAAKRLSKQLEGQTDIKIVGHSRGGALVMEYLAEVAEGKFQADELRGAYAIDAALSPSCAPSGPIASDRYRGLRDRYANLQNGLREKGYRVDLATFDNKADLPWTTSDPLPGTMQYDFTVEGRQGPMPGDRMLDAHGILQQDPAYDVGGIIYRRINRVE